MYRILIVEDDETIAGLVQKHLQSWGYQVDCVSDFSNVLREFVQKDPQLVLLDLKLPFYNGFHWCEEIRRISQVPVLFLSSAADNMNMVMAMSRGADDFIAKPFDLDVLAAKVQAYMTHTMTVYISQVVQAMQAQMSSALTQAMTQLSANMASAMNIDTAAFANAFKFNLDEQQLTELIMSMMSSEEATYDGNLSKLGYADLSKPAGIDIYPIDFDGKQEIIDILDGYNQRMIDEGNDDRAITYTDIVGTLMSSVTTIIDMISYVLIAFVAISLVVSSIMIGVITYISVLERKKEIGILRAIGASKGDVSRVFNAETVIEGLVAGILGVGVTALVCVPISAIVYALFDVPNVAQLPPVAAGVLVAISVLLTFVAGLMPASSASRKDPVEALRSE